MTTVNVFRMQETGIEFEEMQNFSSSNWTTGEKLDGLAAALYEDDLIDLASHWYHGNYAGQEVVEFSAVITDDLGDGVLVDPISEIDRMPLAAFVKLHS